MIRQAAMFSRLRVMMCAAVLIAPVQAFAQYQPMTETDAVVRVEQLENRLRQLTGENEQLQFRVRQLEDQLRAQGGAAAVPAARPNTAMAQPQRQPLPPQQAEPPLPPYPQQQNYPQQPYQQQQAYPQQQPA